MDDKDFYVDLTKATFRIEHTSFCFEKEKMQVAIDEQAKLGRTSNDVVWELVKQATKDNIEASRTVIGEYEDYHKAFAAFRCYIMGDTGEEENYIPGPPFDPILPEATIDFNGTITIHKVALYAIMYCDNGEKKEVPIRANATSVKKFFKEDNNANNT